MIRLLGIVNLTPDSFSDGGKSLQQAALLQQLGEFQEAGFDALDFGAESTAPFNAAISPELELHRLEQFFPWDQLQNVKMISLDTYRPATFLSFYQRIKKLYPEMKIIFNDVSGKLDSELWDCLGACPDADYIFCHNLAPQREDSSDHMKYLFKGDDLAFFSHLLSYFEDACLQFESRGMRQRLILDPCFGFSKTREQNYFLINKLAALALSVAHQRWLVGLSRKSFLRHLDLPSQAPKLILQTEFSQALILGQLLKELSTYDVWIRLHDAVLGSSLRHH